MSPGLERCPPAQPRGKGREAPAAKLLAADAAGRGPALGVGGKAPPEWAGMWTGLCSQGCRRSHLVPGGCPSAAQGGGSSRKDGEAGGLGAAGPAPAPSLTAEPTLDKQLQSIYLRPYGAGKQVCR